MSTISNPNRVNAQLPPIGAHTLRIPENRIAAGDFVDALKRAAGPIVNEHDRTVTPQQMFEPMTPDPNQQIKSQLQSDYREAITSRAGQRDLARREVHEQEDTPASTKKSRPAEVTLEAPATQIVPPQPHSRPDDHRVTSPLSRPEPGPTEHATSIRRPQATTSQAQRIHPSALPAAITATTIANNFELQAPGTPAQEVGRLLGGQAARSSSGSSELQLSQSVGPRSAPGVIQSRNPVQPGPTSQLKNAATPQPAATPFERVMRSLRLQSGKHSTARLMLDPPELGKVHVRVRVDEDRVDIAVATEKETARDLLAQRALKLRHALEEQGWVIGRIDVSAGQEIFESNSNPLSRRKDRTSPRREGDQALAPRLNRGEAVSRRRHKTAAPDHENVDLNV